jgi:hypothetical protein
VLDAHQDGAAPLATDPEALAESQHDEQDRGSDPDRRVGRHEPDEGRRDTHDGQREDQHRLAADPVPEVAEDYAAYGTG